MTVKSKKNKTRKHKKYAKSNAKSNAKAKAKSKKMIKNKNRKGVKRVQKYGGKPMTGEPMTAEQIAQQIAEGKTIDQLTEIINTYASEYSNLSEQRFDNLFNGLPDDEEIKRRINEIEPVLERLRSKLQDRIVEEYRNRTQN